MPKFLYISARGTAENSYRNGDELVILPKASFPDLCVGCGMPAYGNVIEREFFDLGQWWITLPTLLDIFALIFRKHYVFDFPFCPNCPPGSFPLRKIRVDIHLAVFSGACKAFLNSLPFATTNVVEERKRTWLRRRFRWLYG